MHRTYQKSASHVQGWDAYKHDIALRARMPRPGTIRGWKDQTKKMTKKMEKIVVVIRENIGNI